jgi:hypothetical protein
MSDRRRTTFIVLAVLFGLGLGFGAFAFPSLVVGWFGAGGREIHKVHDLAYGAQAGILFAAALVLQSVNPERKPAIMLTAAASGLANAVGYSLGGNFFFGLVPFVVLGLLWWLHPARHELRLAGPVHPLMAGLAVLAAIPLVIYALDQAAIQRACLAGDPHCDEFHYAGMAAIALAIPLAGLVASFSTRGWRISAWLAGLATAVFGLAAMLFPEHTSSVGTTWGAVALGGAVLFVAIAELRARRVASLPEAA